MIFPFVGLFFVGLYLLHGKQMLSGDKGIWLERGRSLGGRWKLIRGGRCRTRWELRLGVFMDGFPSEPLPRHPEPSNRKTERLSASSPAADSIGRGRWREWGRRSYFMGQPSSATHDRTADESSATCSRQNWISRRWAPLCLRSSEGRENSQS